MKRILVWIVLTIIGLLLVRFFLGGDEDAWMCDDGLWIRHGNPSRPMPKEACL